MKRVGMPRSAHGIAVAALALLCVCGPARPAAGAEPAMDETAAEFEALGRRAYAKKNWDDAIAAFEGAYVAQPLPKFLFNLARSYEKRGDLGPAAQYFDRYLEAFPEAKDKKSVKVLAQMLRIKLKKTHRQITLTSSPSRAFVRIRLEEGDESIEGSTPLVRWVPFGAHDLEVRKSGFQPVERELLVQPQMDTLLAIVLESASAEKPSPAPPPAHAAAPEPSELNWGEEEEEPPPVQEAEASWLPWIGVGLGAALLVGGGVAGSVAMSARTEREDLAERASGTGHDVTYADYTARDDAARRNALTANVLFLAGGAAAATGVVLLVTGDVSVAPAAAPGGGWLVLTWESP